MRARPPRPAPPAGSAPSVSEALAQAPAAAAPLPADEPGAPLSFSEELLWFAEHGRIPPVTFLECPNHLSLVLRLEGRLDREALRSAVEEIARRHSVLRSRFPERGGRPVRVIDDGFRLPFTMVDLGGVSEGERTAAMEGVLAEQVDAPFDLQAGPLLRARLVRMGPDVHLFALTVHHIVFDSASRGILARELSALYGTYAGADAPALPPPAARYDDYVLWQRRRLEDGALARLTNAWRARLGAVPRLRFPGGPATDEPQRGPIARRFTLAEEDVEALRRMSRGNAVTPAIGMLALFTLFLHRKARADDVVVGLPLSDRRRREFEELIGLFINVLVVRTQLGGPTFPELLKRVRTGLQEAVAQQDLPYWHWVRSRARETGQPAAAQYQAVFNFMGAAPGQGLELPGLRTESLPVGNRPPGLADLSLIVRDAGRVLHCELSFSNASFSAACAERWERDFHSLVRQVLHAPDLPIAEYAAGEEP